MSTWKLLLRLSIGAALVYLLLSKLELSFAAVKVHLTELPLSLLLGALILDQLGQMLCAHRWAELSTLGGRPAKFKDTFPVYFTGMFFNMCLPTSIGGDVWRIVGLGRKTGSKTSAVASVFMDRNVGLAALLVIGLVASIAAPKICTVEATWANQLYVMPIWPIFLLLIVGFIAANVALFSDSFCKVVMFTTERMRLRFIGARIEKLHDSVQIYRQPLPRYLPSFLISILYQFSEIALVIVLAYGMNINVSPMVIATIVTFQAVAGLLPITSNGIGVREAIFCAVLKGQLGDNIKDEAMALSLAYFGVIIMSSLIGGVVYVLSGVKRPTAAEADSDAVIVNTVASGQ